MWDEPNVGLKCQSVRRDIVFLASITSEVKNDHANVTTQRILNKFIEGFDVGFRLNRGRVKCTSFACYWYLAFKRRITMGKAFKRISKLGSKEWNLLPSSLKESRTYVLHFLEKIFSVICFWCALGFHCSGLVYSLH
mgnify:CR=1 FL=1